MFSSPIEYTRKFYSYPAVATTALYLASATFGFLTRSRVEHTTQFTDSSTVLIYFSCLDKCLQIILKKTSKIKVSFLEIHSYVALKHKKCLLSSMWENKHTSPRF